MTVGLVKQSLKLFSFLLIVGQINASMWVRITAISTQHPTTKEYMFSRSFIVWQGSDPKKNDLTSVSGYKIDFNDPLTEPMRGILIIDIQNGSFQSKYYELSDRYWSYENIKEENQFEYSIGSDIQKCNWCDSTYRSKQSVGNAPFYAACIGTFNQFFGTNPKNNGIEKTIITVICNIDPKTDLINVAKFKAEEKAGTASDLAITTAKLNNYVAFDSLKYSLITKKNNYGGFVENEVLKNAKQNFPLFQPSFYFPLAQYKDQPSDTIYKFRLIKGSLTKEGYATGMVTSFESSKWGYIIGFESQSGNYKSCEGGAGDVEMKSSTGSGDYVSVLQARNVEDIEERTVAMKKPKEEKRVPLVSLKIPGDSENFFRSTGSGEGKKWNQFLNDPNSDWELKRRLIIV